MTKVEELKENEPIKKPTSDDLLEVLNTHFDNLNLSVPEFRFVLDKTVSALLQAVREEESANSKLANIGEDQLFNDPDFIP